MTKREQMLECIEEIEIRQAALEGHDIWQDELVWWMAKAICLLLREAAIADRDEVRAPSKPVVEPTGRADAQRGAVRWIPVSDRLPENDDWVIVTILDEWGDTPWEYTDFGWYLEAGNCWVIDAKQRTDVIAWMPLPEPWEGKEE